MKRIWLLSCAVVLPLFAAHAQTLYSAGSALDGQIEEAIKSELIPGAVLIIGHDGHTLYRKAYGYRALIPKKEPMTVDTIFDVASLTKVVATTTSLMELFERGKLRINDPVVTYLPEFQGGKSGITVRNLMTHFSGLRPDLDLEPRWSGYETGIKRALIDVPVLPPGARFVYSDINFILLGEIVHRLSGKMLSDFARDQIFLPLGMKDTQFQPPAILRPRIAPTEINPDTKQPFRGVVHDETARNMGGVAGHAGLFSTADDLAKFAEMMLGLGARNDPKTGKRARVLSELTVRKFTEPGSPADQPVLRSLGWDIDSPFSSNRGELFPVGSYGHTGFTGTSVWIDPVTKTYVVLLTNSVHPHRGKLLSSFRSKIATTIAASLGIDVPGVSLTGYNETIGGAGIHRMIARNAQTLTGLDVLEEQKFLPLRNKRIGLITNHTGLDRKGNRNIDEMLAAGIQITTLYSPEHGIAGIEDKENVSNTVDPKTRLPVISLYQPKDRRLTPDKMSNVDALVFDIQDVGARFYTYSCTMLYALEEAAKARKPFYVLDRPNPITGTHVEGPMMDKDLEAFVGCFALPVRHGLTFGEMATMANAELKLGANLQVIKMRNWQRGDWFDSTSLPWVNPSPYMRSLNAALLYPGVAMLEASQNYSVGRGTDAPFEQIGADWIDGVQLAQALNTRFIPGVRVYPTRFRPTSSNFAGVEISGVRFVITDREAFDGTRLGLELANTLEKLYPGKLPYERNKSLIGNRQTIEELKAGADTKTILTRVEEETRQFINRRRPFLLY